MAREEAAQAVPPPGALHVREYPGLVIRALARGDEAELIRIHSTPAVSQWWDAPPEGFPWDEPQATRLTIELDGAVAGLIQFYEEADPRYRHATVDVFLDPALHGRGIGSAVVRRVARHLVEERGHHRITIDPAAANAPAVRAYEKAGFTRVGVLRAYERDVGGDGWHDGILLERVAVGDAQKGDPIAE